MKIALCISGMPRSFKRTFESVKRYILDPFTPDVFISTWKSELIDDAYPETDSVEEFIELYQPLKFDIEIFNEKRKKSFETNKFHEHSDQAGRSVSRMIPMYYKIYLADLHRFIYEQENKISYDVIIRCRSDLEFFGELEIAQPKEGVVYYPSINSQNAVNDQFWYCNASTATLMSSLYYAIPELWHRGIFIHGETLLYSYMVAHDLTSCHVNIPYRILR